MAFRTDGAGGPADLRQLPNALASRHHGPAYGTIVWSPAAADPLHIKRCAEGRSERADPPRRRRGHPRLRPARAASTRATASRNGWTYTEITPARQGHPGM